MGQQSIERIPHCQKYNESSLFPDPNNNNYGGYVQIFVPSTIDSSNKVQMYIKMTNGTYYIADTFDNVAASNDVDTLVKTGTNSLTKDTLCPAIATNSTWNGTAKLMGA